MSQPTEEVLRLLEDDARLGAAEIAERTGLAPAQVEALVKSLQEQGVIRRYKAVVNWERLGVEHVFAFIEVKVAPQRGQGFDAVAERIMKFPEVHSLYLMSGTYDLHVVVEGKDMKEIAYFVAEKLAPLDNVISTATHFVLKRYKVDGDVIEDGEKQSERLSISP